MNTSVFQENGFNLQTVEGKISQILFNKEDYMVGLIKTTDKEITFKGNIFGIEKGETITFKGEWQDHPKYGRQFQVSRWKRPLPDTKEKALAYLSSPFVKGCGPVQAARIVAALGDDTINRIEKEGPVCLLGIKGIRKKKAEQITASVKETFELQNIIAELSDYGITPACTIKAYRQFQSNTADVLKKNPYQLTDLKYISFPQADEIAQRMGVSPTSGFRIQSCINFCLNQMCYQNGHCYIPENELMNKVKQLLNKNSDAANQISQIEVKQSIFNLEGQSIVIENGKLYPKSFYTYENGIVERLQKLMSGNCEPVSDLDQYILEYEYENNMQLADEQKNAIRTMFEQKVMVLTGNPGTGKTTVVNAIISIYRKVYPSNKISLSAPTGRASRRLEKTAGFQAQTNHRLLGYQQGQGFAYNRENPLNYDLIVVDEMSMVDLYMAYALLQAIDEGSTVLFIGDVDQLPSVGCGNVLHDLIASGIPTIRLTKIFRQTEQSSIVLNAQRVNHGDRLKYYPEKHDMFLIQQENNENIARYVVASVLRFIKLGYSSSDIMVMSPMHKGLVGTDELNSRLQAALNPPRTDRAEAKMGKFIFRVGDKVMQLVNNLDEGVFNGDIGVISYIGQRSVKSEEGTEEKVDVIECVFEGVPIDYPRKDWHNLTLGYCITIHKSQGSESPVVILPFSMSQYKMLARNLIYTGMTRAKEILVFIGQFKAIDVAIKNDKIVNRNTTLALRIHNNIDKIHQLPA